MTKVVKAPEPAEVKEPEFDAPSNVRRYKLRKRYWDGQRDFAVDEVLSFVEGTQPASAVLVE